MSGHSNIILLGNGYHVWTRKVGEGPIKVLLLHGGPGLTHEYLEIFQDYLPQQGIEIYFYEPLGSFFSDQPDDPDLWNIERFCDEVEEVRKELGLENFYLYGHSWGGMLAIEYALKYGESLKGLIISSATASMKLWEQHVLELRDSMPTEVVERMSQLERQGENEGTEYNELYWDFFGKHFICRLEDKPEPVIRSEIRVNMQVLETMMGTAVFEVNGPLKDWDRWDVLHNIRSNTLLIAGRYDTFNIVDLEEMSRRIPSSRRVVCENGSLLVMWDEPDTYFKHITAFLQEVDAGKFKA